MAKWDDVQYQKMAGGAKPEYWQPKKDEEEEDGGGGGGGGGGSTSTSWGSVASDPWGTSALDTAVASMQPKPVQQTKSPILKWTDQSKAYQYETGNNTLDTALNEAKSRPVLQNGQQYNDQLPQGFTGGDIRTEEPVTPTPVATPTQPVGSNQWLMPSMGFGAPVYNPTAGSLFPPNWANGGGNDWANQGTQVAFGEANKWNGSPVAFAQPSSQYIANGTPDRVQPTSMMTYAPTSQYVQNGTPDRSPEFIQPQPSSQYVANGTPDRVVNPAQQAQVDENAAKRQAAMIMGLQELYRVPDQKTSTTKKPVQQVKKPVYKGYGGGGGSGGGAFSKSQNWQDFLGNMNWKI